MATQARDLNLNRPADPGRVRGTAGDGRARRQDRGGRGRWAVTARLVYVVGLAPLGATAPAAAQGAAVSAVAADPPEPAPAGESPPPAAAPGPADAGQPPPAKAASAPPSPTEAASRAGRRAPGDAVRRFAEHVQRGLDAYGAGRFDDALTEYWAAYAINQNPVLLFNAAQAHRRARRWTAALALYERFLRDDPANPIVPEAEAHATAMRANRDRDHAEQVAATRQAEAAQIADANQALREQVNRLLMTGQRAPKPPLYRRRWFWGVVAGAGAAATGLAVGLALGLRPTLPSSEQGERMVIF